MIRSPGMFTDAKLLKYGRKNISWFYIFDFIETLIGVQRLSVVSGLLRFHIMIYGRLSRWRGDGIGTSVKIDTWNEGFAWTRRFWDLASFIRQPKMDWRLFEGWFFAGQGFDSKRFVKTWIWMQLIWATFASSKIKPFEWWTIGCEHQPEHHWNDFFKY